jgi:hypothetical protein
VRRFTAAFVFPCGGDGVNAGNTKKRKTKAAVKRRTPNDPARLANNLETRSWTRQP